MKYDHRVNVSRPDGRPEAYMLPYAARLALPFSCISCPVGVRHTWKEVVMSSPIDATDGQPHIVCLNHLPDDIVIFDPVTGWCHDKQGNEWEEK